MSRRLSTESSTTRIAMSVDHSKRDEARWEVPREELAHDFRVNVDPKAEYGRAAVPLEVDPPLRRDREAPLHVRRGPHVHAYRRGSGVRGRGGNRSAPLEDLHSRRPSLVHVG